MPGTKAKKHHEAEIKPEAATSMPMFFRDPHPLSPARHAKASIRSSNYAFAKRANSVPIVLENLRDRPPLPDCLHPGGYAVIGDGRARSVPRGSPLAAAPLHPGLREAVPVCVS